MAKGSQSTRHQSEGRLICPCLRCGLVIAPAGTRLPRRGNLGKITGSLCPARLPFSGGESKIVAKHSKHQQRIIKNYYDNREAISLQRLSELVTELYLAEGKARAKHWQNVVAALQKLKVPQSRIDTLVQQDNPAHVARLVEELLGKS